MTRAIHRLLLALPLGIAACGGSDPIDTPAPATPPSPAPVAPAFEARQVSAVVGAAGGEVTLTAADGTLYRLQVPAGALAADVTIRLTTAEPPSGQRLRLTAEPAALTFAPGKSATLVLEPPAAQPFAAGFVLRWSGIPLSLRRAADGSIQTTLVALPGRTVTTARATAARVRALADPAQPCGSPISTGPNNIFDASETPDPVDIATYGDCVLVASDQLTSTSRYEEAIRLNVATVTLVERLGVDETGAIRAHPYLDRARGAACSGRRLALEFVRGVTAQNMVEAVQFGKEVLYWEKQTQLLGATCEGGPAAAVDAVQAKVTDVLLAVQNRTGQYAIPSSPEYLSGLAGARGVADAKREAATLLPNRPASDQALIADPLEQRMLPPVADAMVAGPWNACRQQSDMGQMRAMFEAFGGAGVAPPRVTRAAQYCGVTLSVKVMDAQLTQTRRQLSQPMGGVGPGNDRARDVISARRGETLRLQGPLLALQCPPRTNNSNDALAVFVEGREVRRETVSPYVGSPIDLSIDTLISTANADPATVQSLTVTVQRIGDACGGYWGAHPAPLLTLTLELGAKLGMKLLPSANTGPVASDSAGNLYVLSSKASAWGFTGPEGRFLAEAQSLAAADLDPAVGHDRARRRRTRGRRGRQPDPGGHGVVDHDYQLGALRNTRIDGRTGTVVWDTVFGSADYDDATSMAVDDAGNTYVTGITAGTMPGSAHLGQYDGFIVRIDPNGRYAWGRNLGGSKSDGALSIAVDASGNAYFNSYEDSGIKYLGTWENTDNNQIIYKFGPDGTRLWASTYDSNYREGGRGIGVTAQGIVLAMAISHEIEDNTGESRRGTPYLRRLNAATGGGTTGAMGLGEGAMARDPVGGGVCSIGRNAAYEKPTYRSPKESILTCFDAAGTVLWTKLMPNTDAQLITIDALGVITLMGGTSRRRNRLLRAIPRERRHRVGEHPGRRTAPAGAVHCLRH